MYSSSKQRDLNYLSTPRDERIFEQLYPADRSKRFFRNVGNHQRDYKAYPRRPQFARP
jgi:hypothetical protein